MGCFDKCYFYFYDFHLYEGGKVEGYLLDFIGSILADIFIFL